MLKQTADNFLLFFKLGFHELCSDLERQTDGLVISALEKKELEKHMLFRAQSTPRTNI